MIGSIVDSSNGTVSELINKYPTKTSKLFTNKIGCRLGSRRFQVGNQVIAFVDVLDTGEHHLRSRDIFLWVL